jgi:hypothetical protein
MMKILACLLVITLYKLAHGNVVYEAEQAFSNVGDVDIQCDLGHEYSGGSAIVLNSLNSPAYVIFTVHIPDDAIYAVTLSAFHCPSMNSSLSVFGNGIVLVEDSEINRNDVTVHELFLRTGINTIKYLVSRGGVAIDYISVKGAIPLAVRGATLGYEEIEAEAASYQGTLIGPNRTYCSLPSEASNRMAVQLSSSGNYVEFTPTQAFNAIVVRFSIPNTASGIGQAANLNVLINGQQATVLNVTSYYSWTYGTYPFDRNPGSGNPHHFYDDVRHMFSTSYPGGTKLRLVGATPGITYTLDLVDFYSVPAPYTQPANYLSVGDYGADPSGKSDSAPAYLGAVAAWGQKKAAGVWFPPGTYQLSFRIDLQNGLIVRGAGPWYTFLVGNDVGIDGIGSKNAGIFDLAIFGRNNVRIDAEASTGVGQAISDSQVQNVWVEHDKCGMWLDGPFDHLLITGCTIRNTWADGINFHISVTNSVVEQTVVRNTGDDCLAMWPSGTSGSNVFRFNTLSVPVLANTIAIYGGSNNSATDNYCADTIIEGAGLQTGIRFGSTPLSGTTYFARNTLVRTGSGDMYNPQIHVEGAIWLYSDSILATTPIIFEDITIIEPYFQAIEFFQVAVTNVNFTNIKVSNARYLWDTLVPVSAYAQGVVATNVTASVNNCNNQPLKIVEGPGNSGWNLTDVKCEQ